MQQNIFSVTLPLLASVTATTTNLPPVLPPPPVEPPKIEKPFSVIKEFDTEKTAILEVAPEKPKEKRLVCKGCNTNEVKTLAFLQDNGITDKNAIATIMGNIRQESTFIPNICEGGARVSYNSCGGGYGLIQWTDSARYYGLGKHAARLGSSPSSIETQLDYMIKEGDWKMIEPYMKTPGQTIPYYMRLASKWIRWGHHGARTNYAYDYANRIFLTEI